MRGVEIESVRTGQGDGPTTVANLEDDRFTITGCHVGFPMMSKTTLTDDSVVFAAIIETPPGSRWCGIDLAPGALVAYGPGAQHTAVNVPGLRFAFIATDIGRLMASAESLGVDIRPPERGTVGQLDLRSEVTAVGSMLGAVCDLPSGTAPSLPARDDLLTAVVKMLALQAVPGGQCRRAVRSREIVHCGVDHAEEVERIPSVGELCLAACVSERRLREAFVDEFGVPPSTFFRLWALHKARQRFQLAEKSEITVSAVANDLGFSHLGRFAGHYRHAFGVTPRSTLVTEPS